jgi:hypothetical protein
MSALLKRIILMRLYNIEIKVNEKDNLKLANVPLLVNFAKWNNSEN